MKIAISKIRLNPNNPRHVIIKMTGDRPYLSASSGLCLLRSFRLN